MYATVLRVLFVIIAISNVVRSEEAHNETVVEASENGTGKPNFYYLFVKQPRYVKALVKNLNKIMGNETKLDPSWYIRKIQKMGYILKIPVIPGKELAFKKVLKGYKLPLMRMKKRRGYLSDKFVTLPDESMESKSGATEEESDEAPSNEEYLDPEYYDYLSIRKPGQVRRSMQRRRKPLHKKTKGYRKKNPRNSWIQMNDDEDETEVPRRPKRIRTMSRVGGDVSVNRPYEPTTPAFSSEEITTESATPEEFAVNSFTTGSPEDFTTDMYGNAFRKSNTDIMTTTEDGVTEDPDDPIYSLNDVVRLSNGIIRKNKLIRKGSCCTVENGTPFNVGYGEIREVQDDDAEK